MRTGLGVDARVGQAQALHRPAIHKVFLHNFRGIFGLHMPVPDRLGIDHNRRPMLALVEAAGFVDPDGISQARSLGELLQLRMQLALSIRSARRPRSAFRTGIMADKNVTLEQGQSMLLLLQAYRAEFNAKLSTFAPAQPASI